MLRIHPFPAVLPRHDKAHLIASPPYDVIETYEARTAARDNPFSFLHVIRSEVELPEWTDPYSQEVYDRARDNLRRFIADGVLARDTQPGMFLYRQEVNGRSQTGLVCCCHIDDYLNNTIRKHEYTLQAKEDDRVRHVLTTNAHTEPVFLTFKALPQFEELAAQDTDAKALFDFVADDGVVHRAWRISNPEMYMSIFKNVESAYIADGHHRAAGAARAGVERRGTDTRHTGEEEYNWFMAVLFPHDQLTILPYNRVVTDLNGMEAGPFLDALASKGRLHRGSGSNKPTTPGSVCIYLDGEWHTLDFMPPHGNSIDPVNSLDVQLLQVQILEPLLGIDDPRTDERIRFVGGTTGTAVLERLVDCGRAAVAFSMYPTTVEELMTVSDAGHVMPPKSTWFEPKLRSGLFVHMMNNHAG